MISFLVITFAGLAAGALNAVAGGGTFISFPALVWLGVPPVMANATATLSALPGYASSTWAFRHDMNSEGTLGLGTMSVLAALGGLVGAGLLMITPGKVFAGVVPWLLLVATALFAIGPRLIPALGRSGQLGAASSAVILILVSVYGGYFNGGLGILLLAVFGLMGFVDLHGMNGMKTALSTILAAVSALAYATAGLIAWDAALLLAISTTVGGYLGGR